MTIILKKQKLILVKTFKSGSTSLYHYLASKLLTPEQLQEYKSKGFFENDEYVFTHYRHGHETYPQLVEKINFSLDDFTCIAVLRAVNKRLVSSFNQFMHEKMKLERWNGKTMKLIRFLYKKSFVRIAYLLFYFRIMKSEGLRYLKTRQKHQLKSYLMQLPVIGIDYKEYYRLEDYLSCYNYVEHKKKKYREFKEKKLKRIPRILRKKIKNEFSEDIRYYNELKETTSTS